MYFWMAPCRESFLSLKTDGFLILNLTRGYLHSPEIQILNTVMFERKYLFRTMFNLHMKVPPWVFRVIFQLSLVLHTLLHIPGQKLLTASFDNTAKIWEVIRGRCVLV